MEAKMTQHTPGPWLMSDPPVDEDTPIEIVHDDSDDTDVLPMICEVSQSLTTAEQAIADARLIAASPDMEAALSYILVLIQQGVDDQDLEAIEEHCRCALGKAWGCRPEEVTTPDLEEVRKLTSYDGPE